MLYLSVLIENNAADGFVCEHGLSFLLESDDAVILFDTGESGAFLDNAARMGCDLGKVTHVVLSHGHFDHSGGLGVALRHLREKKNGTDLPPVIGHPGVLAVRKRSPGHPNGHKMLDMPDDSRKELASWPQQFSVSPMKITDSIVFLGEVPHRQPEMCTLVGHADYNGVFDKDMIHDDTGLAYITDKGLIIVAGCSHSGIVNVMEHAKAVTGVQTIRAVYGGLHCKDMTPENVEKTRNALKAENLEELYACHCTGDALNGFPGMVSLAAGQSRVILP